jgi:hypothetical protein
MRSGIEVLTRVSGRPHACVSMLLLAYPAGALLGQHRPLVANDLPDAPLGASARSFGQEQIASSPNAAISGTVLDAEGAEIPGATIVIEELQTHITRTMKSGEDGSFTFSALAAGSYLVVVTAEGFSPWIAKEIVAHGGETSQLPQIALDIAPVNSTVDAVFTPYEIAEDQIKAEEKQRVLGLVPNFYVVYDWHAVPLSPGQKFRLALRVEIAPFTFIGSGVVAGIEQGANSFPGYGQGAAGFGKRYAASYADGFTGTLLGGAVFPMILHQDPRYFYKGTGSVISRALYAISTVVICKGDNGRWQPNYSSILGDLASAGISNAYYPASNRNGAGVTIDNALIGAASGAVGSLLQEFFLRRVTPSMTPHTVPQPQPLPPQRAP